MTSLVGPLAAAIVVLSQLSASAAPQLPSNPRKLASLVQRWNWKGLVSDAVLADDQIFVTGNGRITALSANDGRVLWERVCLESKDYVSGTPPLAFRDTVAVGFDDHLYLLDRANGRLIKDLPLDGWVGRDLAGPPLLVRPGRDGREQLMRIDERTGAVVATRPVTGRLYGVQVVDGVAVALFAADEQASDGSDLYRVVGYRTDTLEEIWAMRVDCFPDIELIRGRLHLGVLAGKGEEARTDYRPIDLRSGELGPALPSRGPSNVSGGLTWELQITSTRDERSPARLRRNAYESGAAVWTATLPGDPTAWVLRADELFVHCSSDGGRGSLVVLDWATGRIKRAAYGLRDVRTLFSFANTLIARNDDGLVAFQSGAFGPSSKNTGELGAEVGAILDAVQEGGWPRDQAADSDLQSLGRAAWPVITRMIPTLKPPALAAAARVLGGAAYRPAAIPLAARVGEPAPPCERGGCSDNDYVAVDVLRALSRIGRAPQVEQVAAILDETGRDPATRLQALATLASIGRPAAIRAIDRHLSRPIAPRRWWQPPSPADFAAYVGRADLPELQKAASAQDFDLEWKLHRAADAARVQLPEGGALLVFHDGRIGGEKDLWVAHEDANARVEAPAAFIGSLEVGVIRATLDGDTLVVQSDRASAPLCVLIRDVGKDSDGDLIPDLAERRLELDPNSRDTDGDGVIDSEDPAPNGGRPPVNEREAIACAIYDQFSRFYPFQPGVTIVHFAVHAECAGAWGASISLTDAGNKQFVEAGGWNGVGHVFVEPGRHEMGVRLPLDGDKVALGAGARRYSLTIWRGGLDAVGYDVVVRKRGGRWVITECRMAWLS